MKIRILGFVSIILLGLTFSATFAEESSATDGGTLRYPLSVEGPKPRPLENPPSRSDVVKSVGRGVQYLLESQNKDGSWGSPGSTKQLNIYAPVPGALDAYLCGSSALALSSLLEAYEKTQGENPELTFEQLDVNRYMLLEAIERGEDWLMEYLPKLRRSSNDVLYNNWGHAYGIRAFCRMIDRTPDDKERNEKIRGRIRQQIEFLEKFECIDGGWCYYDFDYGTKKTAGSPNSFVTATVLLALRDAKDRGIEVPQRIVDRGMASMLRQRYGNFTYAYGEYLKMRPMMDINTPPGSVGRSQACNLAMQLWGDKDVSPDVHRAWLDRLFARNGWLDVGRKRPIPHESFFQVAGYFFYYGHFYAAFCIEELPEAERNTYRAYLADVMIGLQEKNGSWFDYELYDYHNAYGTGYAVMSMLRAIPD